MRIEALNTSTPNLANEPTLANGPPGDLRIDAFNTSTPNLANEPTLANGPPSEFRIDALNTSTQNVADGLPKCIMGYILWDVFGSHFGFFKKRWEIPFISE